jgi:hypothetical protein
MPPSVNFDYYPAGGEGRMKLRWLVPLGLLLVVTASARAQIARLGAPVSPLQPVGYLVATPARPQTAPYEPRPGDIVLYDDFNKFYRLIFKLANTSAPTHVAMVIARPDGTPALLELTGPRMITAKVSIVDIEPRLTNYSGAIMVRRIREPLTPKQSHDLTQFAQSESGKSFALGRVMLQATLFCPRNGLRREWFGKTYLSRDRWFCSEMVVAACASAHLLDPNKCCANATYPRDLAYDEALDLSRWYHPPVAWAPATAR